MQKNYTTFTGNIHSLTDTISIKRASKKDFFKRIIGLKTEDNQLMFIEARNSKLALLENVSLNDYVTVEVSFEGSEKNDKQYNNIFLYNLKVL